MLYVNASNDILKSILEKLVRNGNVVVVKSVRLSLNLFI